MTAPAGGDGSGEHESGVSQTLFDATAGADGTLERTDVIDVVRAYLTDNEVGDVSLYREDVLALVQYYILQ